MIRFSFPWEAILAASFFPFVAFAQFSPSPAADNEPVKEVVVTASRFEESPSESTGSLKVISADEIEARGWQTVEDILQNQSGVDLVRNGGPGGNAVAFIRGANSEHTLVLIDGVEVNNPATTAGTFDFSGLTVDNIERVEILRGPQSVLYGSSALGGVINIITRKGQGAPAGGVSLEGGSYATFTERAWFAGESAGVNYSLGASRRDSDGMSAAGSRYGNSERDGLAENAFSGRFGAQVSDNLEGALLLRGQSSKADLDMSGGIDGDDPNRVMSREALFTRLQGASTFADGALRQDFGISYTREGFDDDNDPDMEHPFDKLRSSYDGDIFKLDFQNTWRPLDWLTWVVGVENKQESAESIYRSESAFGPYDSDFANRSAYTTGSFTQARVDLSEGLSTTYGLRFDRHSRTGDHLTWRLAPVYALEESGTRLFATIGTGFKSPSLFQLYSPYGSPDLNPEESLGMDVGVQQTFMGDRLTVGVTWFRNNFDELITFDPDTFIFSNISKARSAGFEYSTRLNLCRTVSVGVDLAYTDTEDKSTRETLLRRPHVKVSTDISYDSHDGTQMALGLVSVGKRDDNNYGAYPAERVELTGYTLLSLTGSYDVSESVEFFARIENILDSEYEDVYGYGTPGIAAYGGLRFKLG